MAGAARRRDEGQTHAFQRSGVVAGRLHALDVHGHALQAELLFDL